MVLPTKTVTQIFFFLLLSIVTIAFFNIIYSFLKAIFWAVLLALLFRPLQQKLLKVFPGRPVLGAMLTMVAIVVSVLIPLTFIGLAVAQEAATLADDFEEGNIDTQSTLLWLEQRIPFLSGLLERFQIDVGQVRQGVSEAAIASGKWIAGNAVTIGQSTLQFFLHLFVMLYVLFFFIKDGTAIMLATMRVVPLDEELQQNLRSRFANVARATLKGTFLISVIQGFLGGLAFWALDLRAPVLWGVVMALFALLPAIGPPIVWLPAAIVLIASGEAVKGIVLIVIGAVVIGIVDNLLRPVLVGRDARLPDYVILLTTLGGIAVFGLSGVVIGPIIAALFFTVWQTLADRQEPSPEALASGERGS
ncbi:MAG: AI-2E family transporter [Woeseia sp.]